MPKVVRNYKPKGKRPRVHPIQEWYHILKAEECDAAISLEQGKDFDCDPRTLQETIWKWGKERGIKFNINREGDTLFLRLRKK